MPEIKWRLTSSWPKSLDTLYGGAEFFCKRVAEITDNKFQIQLFAAGEIVPGLQVLDAVQNGTVEMGHTALYYYFGKDPAFTFGTALPFGLNSRQMNAWLHYGGGNELLNELLQEVQLLSASPAGNTGAQMGGWFRKEIKTLDDLKGLKMRIGGFAGTHRRQARRGAAAACRRRHLSGAGEGHDRRRRMGRPLRRREARLPQGRAVLLLSGLVGRLRPGPQHRQSRQVERAAEDLQAAFIAASHETWGWMLGKYDAGNPPALRRLVAAARSCGRSRRRSWRPATRPRNEIYAELSKTNPHVQEAARQRGWRSATTATRGCRSPSSASTAS